jgi:hypothetical protein
MNGQHLIMMKKFNIDNESGRILDEDFLNYLQFEYQDLSKR